MVFFYSKEFEAEQLGNKVVGVRCDHCATEYYYVLTRIGSGGASAPYAMASGGAARRAVERSQRNLQKRLALEAELVPCPACQWINEELVAGYRLGRHRWMGTTAWVVGLGGTALSLLVAWYMSMSPMDRGQSRNVFIGGPAIFLAFAASMLVLLYWLRSRIQPNRSFPLAPSLPAGTPPAMLLDTLTGQLRVAKADRIEADPQNWIDIQVGRQSLPPCCCGCLKPTMELRPLRVSRLTPLGVPFCKECSRRQQPGVIRAWLMLSAGVVLALGLEWALVQGASSFWGLAGATVVLWCFVAFAVNRWVTSLPVAVVSRDASRGVIRLRFQNSEYARLAADR